MASSLPPEIWLSIILFAADEDVLSQPTPFPTSFSPSAWFPHPKMPKPSTPGGAGPSLEKEGDDEDDSEIWHIRTPTQALASLMRRSYATKKAIMMTCKFLANVCREERVMYRTVGVERLQGLVNLVQRWRENTTRVGEQEENGLGWGTKRIVVSISPGQLLTPVNKASYESALVALLSSAPNTHTLVITTPLPSFSHIAHAISSLPLHKTLCVLRLAIRKKDLGRLVWLVSGLKSLGALWVDVQDGTIVHESMELDADDRSSDSVLGTAAGHDVLLPTLTQLTLTGPLLSPLITHMTSHWTLPHLTTLSLNSTSQTDVLDLPAFAEKHGSKLVFVDVNSVRPWDVAGVLQRCEGVKVLGLNADLRYELEQDENGNNGNHDPDEIVNALTSRVHESVTHIGLHGLEYAFTAESSFVASYNARLKALGSRSSTTQTPPNKSSTPQASGSSTPAAASQIILSINDTPVDSSSDDEEYDTASEDSRSELEDNPQNTSTSAAHAAYPNPRAIILRARNKSLFASLFPESAPYPPYMRPPNEGNPNVLVPFPNLTNLRVLSSSLLLTLERLGGPDEQSGGRERWERWWDSAVAFNPKSSVAAAGSHGVANTETTGVRFEDCTGALFGSLPSATQPQAAAHQHGSSSDSDSLSESGSEDDEYYESDSSGFDSNPTQSRTSELRALLEECRLSEEEGRREGYMFGPGGILGMFGGMGGMGGMGMGMGMGGGGYPGPGFSGGFGPGYPGAGYNGGFGSGYPAGGGAYPGAGAPGAPGAGYGGAAGYGAPSMGMGMGMGGAGGQAGLMNSMRIMGNMPAPAVPPSSAHPGASSAAPGPAPSPNGQPLSRSQSQSQSQSHKPPTSSPLRSTPSPPAPQAPEGMNPEDIEPAPPELVQKRRKRISDIGVGMGYPTGYAPGHGFVSVSGGRDFSGEAGGSGEGGFGVAGERRGPRKSGRKSRG